MLCVNTDAVGYNDRVWKITVGHVISERGAVRDVTCYGGALVAGSDSTEVWCATLVPSQGSTTVCYHVLTHGMERWLVD